ncbi:hypothetical protein C8R42DRAFT_643804 [Lentinula raphanica]|nr:hypothetical protein C8R42DRAFT_643804 [Lentinula raphanica]
MVAVIHAHPGSSANRGRIGGMEMGEKKLETLTERRRLVNLSSTLSSPGNSLLFLTKIHVVLIFVLKSSSFSSSSKIPVEQISIEQRSVYDAKKFLKQRSTVDRSRTEAGQKQIGVKERREGKNSMTNSNTSKNLNIPTLMISTSIDDVQATNIAQRRVFELRHNVLGACQTFANFRTNMTQAAYSPVDKGISVGISSQVNRMVKELHRVEARTGTPSSNSVENIHRRFSESRGICALASYNLGKGNKISTSAGTIMSEVHPLDRTGSATDVSISYLLSFLDRVYHRR